MDKKNNSKNKEKKSKQDKKKNVLRYIQLIGIIFI